MNRVGVCSWSLRPSSPAELAARVRAVGVEHVQLALEPLRTGAWTLGETREALRSAGVEIASGMLAFPGEDYSTLASIERTGGVRADARWPDNLEVARGAARVAAALELELVSFHAGFLPESNGSAGRATMVERLQAIVDAFAEHGVRTAFETGQERAETLQAFLEELARDDAGVNFDPANVILYDRGDPHEALRRLAPWVRQIHVKDARRTRVPGEWGEEVPVGEGEVDWRALCALLLELGLDHDLMIEREAGAQRFEDIRAARDLVLRELGRNSR
jgi:sugar phosphate isomerase/epimerase